MKIPHLLSIWALSAPLWAAPPEGWQASDGVLFQDGVARFESKRNATVGLMLAPHSIKRWDLLLAAGAGSGHLSIKIDGEERYRYQIRKTKEGDGLTFAKMEYDEKKWTIVRNAMTTLPYRPPEKTKIAWDNLRAAGLEPKRWSDRPVKAEGIRRSDRVELRVDGVMVATAPVLEPAQVEVEFSLPLGDAIRPGGEAAFQVSEHFVPLPLGNYREGEAKEELVKGEIPFLKGAGVDLRKAEWPYAATNPGTYFAVYDSGPMFLHDPRVPTFWAPADEYRALHLVIRRAEPAEGASAEQFSVRLGVFGLGMLGGRGQVLDHVYHVTIPKEKGEHQVTLSLTESLAQDLRGPLQISFGREMRLVRRTPDASRFEYRPTGLPAGVEVLGATLEQAPLRWKVTAKEGGSIFEGRQVAQYEVTLENPSRKAVEYELHARAVGQDGEHDTTTLKGTIPPGEKKVVPYQLTGKRWGYYDSEVVLTLPQTGDSLRRVTSFALLPEDRREHRATSPFGTWTWDGGHQTCDDPDVIGSLLKKAGLRFGLGRFPEARKEWGVVTNFEPKKLKTPEQYEKWREQNPDALPVALLMHEDSVSADQVTRVPDHFTGRKPYELNEREKERFKTLWDDQIAMAKMMREKFPYVHLRLGNGPVPTKEIFLQNQFPAELFDSLGNEAGSFGRPPEAQPPDFVANNASLWMDHELLKAYGYEKPVTQCYEIIYPSTNPGNLTQATQAAYFVRHAMHSLAWGIREIRFGTLDDVSNAYRFGNWGASGLMNAWPHLNPKPSYVAVATMTRLLDGATYLRALPTGRPSVYAVEFNSPTRGRVYALWNLRGDRKIALTAKGNEWQITDWEGNEQRLDPEAGITIGEMPLYVSGQGELLSITPMESLPDGATAGTLVAALSSLEGWSVEEKPDAVLEYHNPLTPRRPGQFTYQADAAQSALEVRSAGGAEGSPVLPLYGAIRPNAPVLLPGEPTEISLEVEGNSGFGRVIFELEDARGQKWTSIGASRKGELSEWMLDWLPAEFAQSEKSATQSDWNCNDVFGLSVINYDGWRTIRFPLPGNYPGEQTAWPANSQWRSDGDGVVRYPLKLTRLIFELPERILKLTDYTPAGEQVIRVRRLAVSEGTQGGLRPSVLEHEPASLSAR